MLTLAKETIISLIKHMRALKESWGRTKKTVDIYICIYEWNKIQRERVRHDR